MLQKVLLVVWLCCSGLTGFCQEGFVIDKDRRSTKIKFELVNNLIIVPVELNGVELSFLLDTGVNTSVLLNLEEGDSLDLRNTQKIRLRGLGGEELIEAYRSQDNVLRIGKTINSNLTLYLIYDADVNFSPRLGVPVHGILGHDFFKDFVVEINYVREFIRVHDPDRFRKSLRRYSELPLRFYQNKPYLKAGVTLTDQEIPVTLLIDNGLGDALWLFNENADIQVPEKSFDDFLGLGLLGDVTGKRSRIRSVNLGGHRLEQVTAAFPDSSSVQGLRMFEERNGSIGAEVLRRFHMVLDYPMQKIYLRKNRHFDDEFNYDMSGITLEHSGFIIVETYEKVLEPSEIFEKGEKIVEPPPQMQKKFELKPSFQVVNIRPGSPADRAGLQVGDLILSVNGRDAYKYNLEELGSLLSSEEGRRIRIEISRGLEELAVEFRLEKIL